MILPLALNCTALFNSASLQAHLLQADSNPVLEREIGLHLQILRFKEFTLHNRRRRYVFEIKNIHEQIKDITDELKKYEKIVYHQKLLWALRDHYHKYNK